MWPLRLNYFGNFGIVNKHRSEIVSRFQIENVYYIIARGRAGDGLRHRNPPIHMTCPMH